MLTRKGLMSLLDGIYRELEIRDITPDKMILFGSYAKGNLHEFSDVDIAIWNKKFIGEGLIDFELVQPILKVFRKVNSIDFKMYPTGATANNFDPFIEEIEKDGLMWNATTKQLEKCKKVMAPTGKRLI